ncbi:MAG: ABC-2 transporter permease [Clostridia bacterium]|nr:ABC-2 transporter permease [Clostridia bacterium]
MWAVYKRELMEYYLTPIGYIFMGFFLIVSGYFFSVTNLLQANPFFNNVLSSITFIFLFIVPILTMRLIAEESKNNTDQLLITSPLKIGWIVISKYLAALTVFTLTILITMIYPFILSIYGEIAWAEIWGGYLGFFLLGGCFISVGLLISSLTENQIIAAVVTFCVSLLLWVIDFIKSFTNNAVVIKIIDAISLFRRYSEFTMGILSLANIVYYISFIIFFIFLTVKVIERKRWA